MFGKIRFRKIKMILIALMIILVTIVIVSCATTDHFLQFGGTPANTRLARMKNTPNYDGRQFVNPIETSLEMGPNALEMLSQWIFGKEIRVPRIDIPVVSLDKTAFDIPPADGLRITRMGHSSVLIEIDGKRILTDPMWSKRCSPTSLFGPARFHVPPISLEDLPPLNAVLISHDHFDHLDKDSVCTLAQTNVHFYVPLGIGAHLEKWGIGKTQFTEFTWWESRMIENIRLVSTPARHFSGRGIGKKNSTLWTSWSIIGPTHRVFFSGDSGYFSGFAEIGKKYGPFDITLIECGAYNPLWEDVHMMPEQTVEAHIALRGRLLVPIHWGTFELAFHDWFDPPERLSKAAKAKRVRFAFPQFGQMIGTFHTSQSECWWRDSATPLSARSTSLRIADYNR